MSAKAKRKVKKVPKARPPSVKGPARTRGPTPRHVEALVDAIDGGATDAEAARQACGIAIATFHRWLDQGRAELASGRETPHAAFVTAYQEAAGRRPAAVRRRLATYGVYQADDLYLKQLAAAEDRPARRRRAEAEADLAVAEAAIKAAQAARLAEDGPRGMILLEDGMDIDPAATLAYVAAMAAKGFNVLVPQRPTSPTPEDVERFSPTPPRDGG